MNQRDASISRRGLLRRGAGAAASAAAAAAGLSALSSTAQGFQRPNDLEYDFVMPRVKFDCRGGVDYWNVHPGGDKNLLRALSETVRCRVRLEPGFENDNPYYGNPEHFNAVVDFNTYESVRDYPFLFMTAEGQYTFSAGQRANLKRYIDEGGFLLMDDCLVGTGPTYFFDSSVKLLNQVFGGGSVVPVPVGHEIYHNVFDFGSTGLPQVGGTAKPQAMGLFRGERLALFLTNNDIHCGWTDKMNKWYSRVGRNNAHRDAIRIGINAIMYALSH